jgi:hypothetical protein
MGILRTDKISGLETPTAVTGSVVFDGTGDYLTVAASNDFDFGTNDFTMEFWVNSTKTGRIDPIGWNYVYTNAGWAGMILNISPGSGSMAWYENANSRISGSGSWNDGSWHHIAVTRSGNSVRMFLDGTQIGSTYTTSHSYGAASSGFIIGTIADPNTGSGPMDGHISNLRLLKGTVLYTSEFTPPVHELEVIGDTVLLCCNNSDSAGADGTGKTITANGDAAASSVSPGLTRDFTSGTEFSGVTVFDTQGYFVPPSGTTEQRGRGRGLWAGGDNPGGGDTKIIDFIQIQSGGIGLDFGDLTVSSNQTRGVSSFTRGVFGGGRRPHPATSNIMDYVTIATTSNAVDFGDLTDDRAGSGEISSSTRGIFAAGYNPANTNTIDFITIASLGNAQDFGDTVNTANGMAGTQSQTRGILAGANGPSSPNASNVIQFLTIATTGNAQDFGDLTDSRHSASGTSNGIRAIFMGGDHLSPAADTTIDYITISTTGNAQDFGDLETITIGTGGATSDKIRGVFALGYSGSAHLNVIQQVTIATTGDAVQIGDLTALRHQPGCLSDTHGGLS